MPHMLPRAFLESKILLGFVNRTNYTQKIWRHGPVYPLKHNGCHVQALSRCHFTSVQLSLWMSVSEEKLMFTGHNYNSCM